MLFKIIGCLVITLICCCIYTITTSPKETVVIVNELETDVHTDVHNKDNLTVSLPSMAGTGYSWRLTKFDKNFVCLMDELTYDFRHENQVGGPERQIFRFNLKNVGKTNIEFTKKAWFNPESHVSKCVVKINVF